MNYCNLIREIYVMAYNAHATSNNNRIYKL